MFVVCSFCQEDMGEKEPFENVKTTHGICPDCYTRLLHQAEGMSFDEYLEQFEVPVLVVNSEGRIAAANGSALSMLQKPPERVVGFLGGEAMECKYSRLPEGCGQTEHCETCSIRRLVMQTIEDQHSHHNLMVSLMTDKGRVMFHVSSVFRNGMVFMVIEDSFSDETGNWEEILAAQKLI